MRDLTVFVCTYNSAATLEKCLASINRSEPDSPIVVIDQDSRDTTVEIAQRFHVAVHSQNVGLGYSRQLAFELARTEYLSFVDSDVEVVQTAFFRGAVSLLHAESVGAVVGMGVGHKFQYGLPMTLLVLRSRDFKGKVISSNIGAREEFFIKRRLAAQGLSTVFIPAVMIHKSQFRRYKPEWEGANTRIATGIDFGQSLFVLKVFILQSLNSKSIKNILYVPISYLKFLRGFVQPDRWRNLKQAR